MQADNKLPSGRPESEIDLGVFFSLIGKIFSKVFNAISSFFFAIYSLVIDFLIFIKRRILWIGLAALIGFSLGAYEYLKRGPVYYSDMVVRANHGSARLLYNQIDYYNSLIKLGRINDLKQIFGITDNQAKGLKSFTIDPIDDDIETSKLYRELFLDFNRADIYGSDTLYLKTMKFQEFKKNLSGNDYPLQTIRLYTTSADVYPKIQNNLIDQVNQNKNLQQVKMSYEKMFEMQENVLERSLVGLDSLRQAYNKRILNIGSGAAEGNNVVVSNREARNPEIDLYDKELTLKDELASLQRRHAEQQDIIQVNTAFNPIGSKTSGLYANFTKYALWAALLCLVIMILIELFKYLNDVDRSRRKGVSA